MNCDRCETEFDEKRDDWFVVLIWKQADARQVRSKVLCPGCVDLVFAVLDSENES
jgi:hypothetical protein